MDLEDWMTTAACRRMKIMRKKHRTAQWKGRLVRCVITRVHEVAPNLCGILTILPLLCLTIMLAGCASGRGSQHMTFPTQDDLDYNTPYTMGEGLSYRTLRFDPNRSFGTPYPEYNPVEKKWAYAALQFENLVEMETSHDFDAAKPVSEGLAAVKQDDLWGYIAILRGDDWTEEGKPYGYEFAIEPVLEMAEPFVSGMAAVMQDGLYGYVDRGGQWVIEPKYRSAHWFDHPELYAAVEDEQGWHYIDKKGRVAIPGPFDEAESFTFAGEGAGSEASDAGDSFDRTGYLAPAASGGLWGYLDAAGNWAIPPRFEDAWVFDGGTAVVKRDGKWKQIRPDGKVTGSVKNPVTW